MTPSSSNINNNSVASRVGPAALLVKPKRPLSSYNLFYRFKREKIIELGNTSKAAITSMINAPPGLEDCYTAPPPNATSDEINTLRNHNIRKDMEHNLSPRETSTRRHRKNTSAINGGMSFLELGKLMNASWQNCDDVAKSVFDELANIGRDVYRQKLVEYNTANNMQAEKHHARVMMKMNAASAEKNKRKRAVETVLNNKTTTKISKMMNDGGSSPTPSTASTTMTTLETIPSLPLYNNNGNVVVSPQSYSPTSFAYAAVASQQQQQQWYNNHIITTPPQSPPYPPEIKRRRFSNLNEDEMYMMASSMASQQQQHQRQHLNQHQDDEQDYILLNSNISKLEEQLAIARMKVRVMEMESDLYRRRSFEEQQAEQFDMMNMLSSSSSSDCYPPSSFGGMLSSLGSMARGPYHHHPQEQEQFRNGQTSPKTTTSVTDQGSVSPRSLSSSSLSTKFEQQQQEQEKNHHHHHHQDGLSCLATASMVLGKY